MINRDFQRLRAFLSFDFKFKFYFIYDNIKTQLNIMLNSKNNIFIFDMNVALKNIFKLNHFVN